MKKKKKRKVNTTPTQPSSASNPTKKPEVTAANPEEAKKVTTQKQTPSIKKKSDETTTTPSNQNEQKKPAPLPPPNQKTQALYDKITSLKYETDHLLFNVITQTKELTPDHLPRAAFENIRLSLKPPPGKKHGDEISFTNPKIKGQKLRATIPVTWKPGEKFQVFVRAPGKPSEKDENKFPKDYKLLLEDYTRAYDGWVDAETEYRKKMDCLSNYKHGNEKMKKFNDILPLFPSGLRTPVDGPYLRKVVRKVRQNSNSRKQLNSQRKKSLADSIATIRENENDATTKPVNADEDNVNSITKNGTSANKNTTDIDISSSHDETEKKDDEIVLKFPERSDRFPEVLFCLVDFHREEFGMVSNS